MSCVLMLLKVVQNECGILGGVHAGHVCTFDYGMPAIAGQRKSLPSW